MRFFLAISVASVGLGCYAVAALLFDRRRQVAGWLQRRRTAAAGASAPGAAAAVQPSSVYLPILGGVLLGTLLLVGACMGLIAF
jgi:hypothetical protein